MKYGGPGNENFEKIGSRELAFWPNMAKNAQIF